MTADLRALLAPHVPTDLLTELLSQHIRAHQRFRAGDAEGCLEAIGKFAETAVRVNEHLVLSSHTPLTNRLDPFDQVTRRIETAASGSAPEGLRIIAPRTLLAMYTIRNKRRGGHVSGEVSPQRMDAVLTLQMADWFVAEVARCSAGLPLDEGQALVDSLVQREIPGVYRDEHVHLVTRTDLPLPDEILVLLYSEPSGLAEQHLVSSTKKPRSTVQSSVRRLEASKHVYKTKERPFRVRLLPAGTRAVETRDLLQHQS